MNQRQNEPKISIAFFACLVFHYDKSLILNLNLNLYLSLYINLHIDLNSIKTLSETQTKHLKLNLNQHQNENGEGFALFLISHPKDTLKLGRRGAEGFALCFFDTQKTLWIKRLLNVQGQEAGRFALCLFHTQNLFLNAKGEGGGGGGGARIDKTRQE